MNEDELDETRDLNERLPLKSERMAQEAKEDTADDVKIWLSICETMIEAGVYGTAPQYDRAERVADRILEQFRTRWPRRDGKHPLAELEE